ncbi:hypothetical protein Tco_0107361, partial [Tanacetum coccineum]
EEFVQSIQTFLTNRKNLSTDAREKKKTLNLPILNVRFVRKDGREVFGMPIPDALLTDEITKNTRLLKKISRTYKQMLSTAVKLWTCNLVIRQRVKDFQLCIESYQPQLNLTKPGWDATGYEFKYDYTIIESPRADVTRSKEFIIAIERRLKTRRIYQNLECFVGGRVRDIDYRLL